MVTPYRTGAYEAFEHTADVGLRVWAPTVEDLFSAAAAGLIDTLLDPATVRRRESRPVCVQAPDQEGLLVGWLEELVFAFDAESFAPASAHVDSIGDSELLGHIWGEVFDPERHAVRKVVNAVTYHELQIVRTDRGYEVRVVLDV
jgi:SHS2 domain-containing protein